MDDAVAVLDAIVEASDAREEELEEFFILLNMQCWLAIQRKNDELAQSRLVSTMPPACSTTIPPGTSSTMPTIPRLKMYERAMIIMLAVAWHFLMKYAHWDIVMLTVV